MRMRHVITTGVAVLIFAVAVSIVWFIVGFCLYSPVHNFLAVRPNWKAAASTGCVVVGFLAFAAIWLGTWRFFGWDKDDDGKSVIRTLICASIAVPIWVAIVGGGGWFLDSSFPDFGQTWPRWLFTFGQYAVAFSTIGFAGLVYGVTWRILGKRYGWPAMAPDEEEDE